MGLRVVPTGRTGGGLCSDKGVLEHPESTSRAVGALAGQGGADVGEIIDRTARITATSRKSTTSWPRRGRGHLFTAHGQPERGDCTAAVREKTGDAEGAVPERAKCRAMVKRP